MNTLLIQNLNDVTNTVPSNLWSSDSIDDIWVYYSKPDIFREHAWEGKVTYKSDSFSAEKKFNADSLQELLFMMNNFIQCVR